MNGIPNGYGEKSWPAFENGPVLYKGSWLDGRMNGEGELKMGNGEIYIGQMRANYPHGRGVKTKSDGAKFTGCFE